MKAKIKEIKFDTVNDEIVYLILEVRYPIMPWCPERFDYSTDEKYDNAEAEYQLKFSEVKAITEAIKNLHLGNCEVEQCEEE